MLEDFIKIHAEKLPDKMAIIDAAVSYTYAQLWEMVAERAETWKNYFGKNNRAVTLRASQTADFLIEYFAIHVAGGVVVPLEKDTPKQQIKQLQDDLKNITIPDQVADILYTTGTTGQSKGVMISHDTIIADAENLIHGQGFTSNLAFVINGPLNHIGSLSKSYPTIMLGSTIIIVDGLKDLNAFFDALDYPEEKVATFLVPASIRILLHFAEERLKNYSDKIDFIETGAAPMPHPDMLRLCNTLPHTRLYNTYASTETGIISTYNFNDGKCMAGCLGKPMPHSKIHITEEGRIACSGKTLMTGYAGDEIMTRCVLKDGMVFTADIGVLDDEGMLHLKGREDDVINVGGFKVAPTEVEDIAMECQQVKDCICIQAQHPILGTQLKLLVVTKDNMPLDKKNIALHLKTKLEAFKIPTAYQQVESIQRTYNGKLNRKFYRQ